MESQTPTKNKLKSLRIVTVDHYMHKPIRGLDPCYTDFRGSAINQIPIIRIFGTDAGGTKTCMHVHGVLPYLYIPYSGRDGDDADRFIYQVATSLDKALNISLGQSNSTAEHIFKILHVKAIPFYGYHPKEHQFLKIYFYNPHFVKRASSLLQNGAILGKVFLPHESHLPYILQFLIDYNLYGMSFLHVPSEVVRYRKSSNEILEGVDPHAILENVERISTSKIEIDVPASYILNRLEINTKKSDHENPGIASIWSDERIRREKTDKLNEPLELPVSQDRILAQPTESDIFYREALKNKLKQINETIISDGSISQTPPPNNNIKKKFNLSNFLSNSVYPSECTQLTNSIFNASHIANHLFNETINSSISKSKLNKTFNADDSIIDEDIISSLSQTKSLDETLNPEEYALLDIMQKLDENDAHHFIDDDSILAPLTQNDNKDNMPSSNPTCSEHVQLNTEDDFADSEDDLFNDFSMVLECNDNGGEIKPIIPQLDGANDFTTPNKIRHRYPPLNVTTISPAGRNLSKIDKIIESLKDNKEVTLNRITGPPQKKPKLSESSEVTLTPSVKPHKKETVIDLTISDEEELYVFSDDQASAHEETHITCRYRKKANDPKQQKLKIIEKTPTKLQTPTKQISITKTPDIMETDSGDITLSPKFTKIIQTSPVVRLKKFNNITFDIENKETNQERNNRYSLRTRKKPKPETEQLPYITEKRYKSNSTTPKNKKKTFDLDTCREWSTCDVAREYDRKHKFYPEPGPSYINFYVNVDIPGYYVPIKDSPAKKTKKVTEQQHSDTNEVATAESFYADAQEELSSPSIAQTLSTDIVEKQPPSATTEKDLSILTEVMQQLKNQFSTSPPPLHSLAKVIITPLLNAPTYTEVTNSLSKYNIPKVVAPTPFYSNPDDVTSRKEVGNTVLQIPSKTLNDLEPFQSNVIPPESSINSSRNLKFDLKKLENYETQINGSTNNVNKSILITPIRDAPKMCDAKQWLKNSKHLTNGNCRMNNEAMHANDDSPIKVRRSKVKLTLNNNENGGCGSDEDDENSCDISIVSLSPVTPSTPNPTETSMTDSDRIESSQIIENDQTPKNISKILLNRKNRRRAKLSLKNKFNNILINKNIQNVTDNGSKSPNIFTPSDSETIIELNDDDDDDDIICTQSSAKRAIGNNNKNYFNNNRNGIEVNHKLETSSLQNNFNHLDGKNYDGSTDHSFGITGASLDNTYGFKMDLENFQTANANLEYNYLTIMSIEVHVPTRGQLKPDPEHDKIACIYYSIQNNAPETDDIDQRVLGILVDDSAIEKVRILPNIEHLKCQQVTSEQELLMQFVKLIAKYDPDIFAGYEIEMASWGYIMQRGAALGIHLAPLFSRVPAQKVRQNYFEDTDNEGTENEYEIKLCGRIFLDVWRLLRSEIALTSYTFENCMYHIVHRRFPCHSYKELTAMWNKSVTKWTVIEYYLNRVLGTMELLNQLDLIGRTCELAKLFGIQFYEVLSRGSQFRVESMMLRIAKPKNIVPVSPSVQQRAHMKAPEYLPLILEPHSRLYSDPLIVLDFQSLYPSMIIAYNYCFSTCLGRVERLGMSDPFEFGASQLRVSPTLLRKLLEADKVTVSPCGAVFVKSSVREGVLPRMLREILDTRLMVKQSMKLHKQDKLLQRVLHSRQLGLKLMANVTYGYTAANFSGRMPCVEVGDSVVSKGRETLERAIKMVDANKKWDVKVVYGDTDSLFVLVPGRTRSDAFRIGAEIADAVTNDNPYPVKLKLEKVYQPSILQTKKRYVGYMYENPDQSKPIYEAKGIETVRRDGCPAVAKMLEKTLKILFDTSDVSILKRYICRQFTKILTGRANVQDLVFAKEFRGIKGYKPGACVPALELTRKWRMTDRRAEPRKGERVPYVIVNGPPGVPLIRLVRSPHEYLADEGLKINAIYYITKAIIPPLNRCLLLIGADVSQWFNDLPRKMNTMPTVSNASIANNNNKIDHLKKSTISQYFSTTSCVADCGAQTKSSICSNCLMKSNKSAIILSDKIAKLDRKYSLIKQLCQSCCGRQFYTSCASLDCPILFVKNQCEREHKQIEHLRHILNEQLSL